MGSGDQILTMNHYNVNIISAHVHFLFLLFESLRIQFFALCWSKVHGKGFFFFFLKMNGAAKKL